MRKPWLWLGCTLLLTACPDDDPPVNPTLDTMVRWWSFHELHIGAAAAERVGDERAQVGGAVDETLDFGGLVLRPLGEGPNAKAQVFSNQSGETYWVSAQAPSTTLTTGAIIGNSAELLQVQYFRKTAADATLRVVVTEAFLAAIDDNGGDPTALECPGHLPSNVYLRCRRTMWAWVSFHVNAFSFSAQKDLLDTGGFAELMGWRSAWEFDAYTEGGAQRPFWNPDSFEIDRDASDTGGGVAQLRLASPITIDVPLGSMRVGDMFSLSVNAKAATSNHRQRESYLSAYFRDPAQSDGLAMTYAGIQPVETPVEKPAPRDVAAAPPCTTGVDPAAGTLQLAAADFDAPELAGDGATIVVTRTGEGQGAVSALLATADGTALAGADYAPVMTQVRFADGETGSRAVRVPLVADGAAEPDETVRLTLSAPMGCAALGAQAGATLTIQDDDQPLVLPPTFTVGGSVTGLRGSGLVLTEAATGSELRPTGGPFAFTYAFQDAFAYEVRVASQPIDPIQVCTIANAKGKVAGANVVDVVVTCVTPPSNGALDPGFGDGGKVTTGLGGGATAMALQGDGKIVLVGGLTLERHNGDGSLDPSFGTAGQVPLVFNGGLLDAALGVAIQPDGRIVVVGATRVGTQDDFAVARYEQDGRLDPTFGTAGEVTTDFSGAVDRAYAVVIQPDGRIVVAGHAATMTPLGVSNDFAVARYTAAGPLDPSFGAGGKVTTNIGGRTDLAYAAALQPDGKIVVAGRVADGGGDNPDVGVVRYDGSGVLDPGFGAQGIVRRDLSAGNWDEASDVVLQPDGKILVAVQTAIGGTFKLAVARFDAGGGLDPAFGTTGLATAPLTTQNDVSRAVALQPDGKILVAGQSANLGNSDLALARFTADGALDPGFASGGTLTVDFFGSRDGAEAVAVQPDGRIVMAGFARNGTTTGLALARVAP